MDSQTPTHVTRTPDRSQAISILPSLLLAMLAALGLGFSALQAAAPVSVLYVAPAGTGPGTENDPMSLHSAVERARQLNRRAKGDILVYLRGGTYRLAETIKLGDANSGFNGIRVVFQNFPGETPVISGGREVTGWSDRGNGLVSAQAGFAPIGSLHVNGVRAILARTPNVGRYLRIKDWDEGPDANNRIEIDPKLLEGMGDLRGARFVTHRNWAGTNLEIESVVFEKQSAFVVPREPWRTTMFSRPVPRRRANQPFYLENARVFLDAPGEWYHDSISGTLYYQMRPGETLAGIRAEIPVVETLLAVHGEIQLPVHDIEFRGLHFRHSAWNALERDRGMLEAQNGWNYRKDTSGPRYYLENQVGAISVWAAERIVFKDCVVSNVDGAGLLIGNWTREVLVEHNVFTDIAGCGVLIGEPCNWQTRAWNPADPREVPTGHSVRGNLVSGTGVRYVSSSAISSSFARNLLIEGNEVEFAPYTGINVGCGWSPAASVTENNVIRGNRIHDVVQVVDDGAAIYTLSSAPNTRIEANWIYNIRKSDVAQGNPVAGIYLDEGGSYITVTRNVIDIDENSSNRQTLFHFNKNGVNRIEDNGPSIVGEKKRPGAAEVMKQAGVGDLLPTLQSRLPLQKVK